MASTITASALKVTITESITLGGVDRGSTFAKTITGVSKVYNEIISVGTSDQLITTFAASKAGGTFVASSESGTKMQYMRITNLDDTNYVYLLLGETAGTAQYNQYKLEAGKSFVLCATDVTNRTTNASTAVFAQHLDTIRAKADTAACDIEIYIASA
tara:strand:- start:668 stop:1141 length:474 start_codon:yes stop_codon:yes gene_type:complete